MSFSADDMKNGRPFECPFPEDLVMALERYIEVHRKVLLDGKGKASENLGPLWISRGSNGMMSKGDIRVRIETITKQELGIAIPPHAMRRKLATEMSTDAPEDIAAASIMLSHEDPDTTAVYYNKAKQADAAQRLQDTLKAVVKRGGAGSKRDPTRSQSASERAGQSWFDF